ncbi:toll/interleukin-1 receptor domain-containing protein [Chitinasiproducens palmae]|uniref:TIR domain-containing protein n=1 Tax=Chitinasiproducens palmae TaxID=1770053 RepID=A0A1H2PMZ1_9BURK|nr:toll/interleukin-1 receptor domain-containing protein [Chitinasiproducens palmae]SDV48025.1 TIR domain-containing protein [Chitinasiproducens palmae]
MTDFFISYTNADTDWAQWISYVLEEEGFTVIVQVWDFRPGSNFVLEMQKAAAKAKRTVMVLSPDYLRSQFASPEWAAAFGQDPQGQEMKLVPVMVRNCNPSGLFKSIVQIRIAGMDEGAARQALVDGINRNRAKPTARPRFPGATTQVQHRDFPGPSAEAAKSVVALPVTTLIPSLKRAPTDVDKRHFLKNGFMTIKNLFETNLDAVSQQEPRIQTDFQVTTATDFRAELFVDGKSTCIGRVWIGGLYSENGIAYSEGRNMSNNSYNEILSLSQGDDLRFQAAMSMGSFAHEKKFDMQRLSADAAAEYLWQRFVWPLRRY